MECIQPESLSNIGKSLFNVIEFDEDEKLYAEIRKHPFGLFVIYLTGTFITLVLLALFVFTPVLLKNDPTGLGFNIENIKVILALVGFLLTTMSVIATAIAAYLYKHNVILVTSEKISQILYISIFNRKISQLGIGDIEDVTVRQVGIFPRIFNYGTIVIETAGEQNNYEFTYAPDPYKFTKAITAAHENDLKAHGN